MVLAELRLDLTSSPGPLAIGSNLLPVNIFPAVVIVVGRAAAAFSLKKKWQGTVH